MRLRVLFTGVATFAVPFTALSLAATESPASARTVGTGFVSCAGATGKVTFSPAWSDATAGLITAKVKITLNRCTGGTPAVSSINVTGKVKFTPGTNVCSEDEETGADGHLTLKYGHGVAPSKFAGYIAPDPGPSFAQFWSDFGGNTVTGSFPDSQVLPPNYYDPSFDIPDAGQTGNCTSGVSAITFNSSGPGDVAVDL